MYKEVVINNLAYYLRETTLKQARSSFMELKIGDGRRFICVKIEEYKQIEKLFLSSSFSNHFIIENFRTNSRECSMSRKNRGFTMQREDFLFNGCFQIIQTTDKTKNRHDTLILHSS